MTACRSLGALIVALALSAAAAAGCGGGAGAATARDGAPPRATTTARTAAPAPVRGPALVAAGDIACPAGMAPGRFACRQADTAALVARLRPDAVAALGDLQYERGSLADFRASFDRTWGRFGRLLHPAAGNHEYGTPGAAGYFATFPSGRAGRPGEGWYAYALGSWHVVVLNANCDIVGCGAGSPQQRWLAADLAAHRARCTLAYWHQPRFSSGLHGSDAALAPLWRTLQQAGADVVLSGHDHDYERFAPQDADGRLDRRHGVVQFVVGGGGRSLYPIPRAAPNSRARASTFGVLRLTLGRGAYAWRFVGAAGGRFHDAGAARCG
ncbi:MAG TPA: metallophosphoesterase [Conexibacter sp.]|nr:metallophosphoesterase [Conexibacter sp.]